MGTARSFLLVATAGGLLAGCVCMRARFAEEDRAAPTLSAERERLGERCDRWLVRECDAAGGAVVWLFRPRIDGPAEAAAYDRASGALLYQRQFGSSGGWAFTPVRRTGAAPACAPALDAAGAEKACAWFERLDAAPMTAGSAAP